MSQSGLINKRIHQTGFALLELSMAMALAASFTMAMLLVWQTENQRAQSKLAGEQYRTVSAALSDYMTLFHDSLLGLPRDCTQVALAQGRSLPVADSVSSGRCRLSLRAVNGSTAVVALGNGLQPTVDELRSLQLIHSTFRNVLVMPTQSVVAQPRNNAISTDLAPPRYAIRIQAVCAVAGCESYQLSGLVYNTQPYSYSRTRSLVSNQEMLYDAMVAAGPDAALSMDSRLNGDGELYGWRGSFNLPNPIRGAGASGVSVGLPGILSVRSGYGSASLAEFARNDGSRNVTGNWNFDGHDVRGIKILDAQQIKASDLQTGTLEANSLQANNLSVSGTANAVNLNVNNSAWIGRISSNAANIGGLSVYEGAYFNVAEMGRLRLPLSGAGGYCDVSVQSVTVSANTFPMLVCR